MKTFYKNQYKIIVTLVMILVLQIAGPLTGNYIYANQDKEAAFEVIATTLENEEVTLDWALTLRSDDEATSYQSAIGFPVEEAAGELRASDDTRLGTYTVAADGTITVDVDESLIPTLESDPTTSGPSLMSLMPNIASFTGTLLLRLPVEGAFGLELMTLDPVDPVSFTNVALEHVDSNGDPVTGDFKVDSHVKMKFEYTIEDYKQVDTDKVYEFVIPKEIPIIADLPLELKDGSRVLANILISPDPTNNTGGLMTVQFLGEVNNTDFNEERDGWISVYSQFGNIDIGGGGDQVITFEVNGESKPVTVKFQEVLASQKVTLEKSGSYNTANNEITWTIKVKPTTEPRGRLIENVAIKDIIQAGQTYIAGSAQLDGAQINPDPVSASQLDYVFGSPLEDGKVYSLSFKTKADLSKFNEQGKTLRFDNTVTGTYGQDNTPTNSPQATVTTKVNFIKKTGKEVAGQGKINWKIDINNNNLELPAGIVIEDALGAGLAFNNDFKIDGQPIANYGTLNVLGQTFTFTFSNPITTKHSLTYSTTVTDTGAYDSNDKQTYKNWAKLIWSGLVGGSANTGEIGVGVSTSVIRKSASGYNPKTHEITWKITVNSNKISIINPVITDHLPATLEYVSATVTGNKLWNFTNNSGNLTLSHIGQIDEAYTITIVTKIKDQYKEYFGSNGTRYISNTAKLTGTGVQNSESTANQKIVSRVIEKNAKGYDYSQRKASWEIIVNQNKMLITNALVTDEIQGSIHTFVAGSLKINGSHATPSQYSLIGNIITINLGTITDEMKISFDTVIPDDQVDEVFKENGNKTLNNKAKLTGDQIYWVIEDNASQTVKNTVISKTCKYTSGNGYIDWEVIVNSNRLPMTNVVLEDILQQGLILDATSVKLNRLDYQADGNYTIDPSPMIILIEYDSVSNKLEFDMGDISEGYLIRFRTDVDDAYRNATFNNTIKLRGSNGEQNGQSSAIGVRFQTGGAGGSGTSTKGSLEVIKVDKEDPDNIIYLQGAQFQLLQNGVVKYTSEETDRDGHTLFDELRMGKYELKEIKAPEGYLLDEAVKEVELKKGVDTKYITYEFENRKIKGNIQFIKRDNNENPLPGAKFSIYHQRDGLLGEAIASVLSDEDGLVSFKGIPYGDYVIRETMAPLGYEPSYEVFEVAISDDNETLTLDPVVNEKIIGDLEVIKVSGTWENPQDEDLPSDFPSDELTPRILDVLDYGETLQGAEFELSNESKVYTGITDNNGRIVFKDIDYGSYSLKETKAPRGYKLSETTYQVEISAYNQEIIRIVVGNEKIKGSLEILKVDSRTQRPLSGASLILYDANMTKIGEQTSQADGKAVFTDLAYGQYFYQETRAPGGYYLDTKVYPLNVPGNEEDGLQDGFIIKKVFENRRRPDDPEPENPQPENPKAEIPEQDQPEADNPEELVPVDEDEIPLGIIEDPEEPLEPEETYLEVEEEEVPLAGPSVPKTGDTIPVVPLMILLIISLVGAAYLMLLKKKKFN